MVGKEGVFTKDSRQDCLIDFLEDLSGDLVGIEQLVQEFSEKVDSGQITLNTSPRYIQFAAGRIHSTYNSSSVWVLIPENFKLNLSKEEDRLKIFDVLIDAVAGSRGLPQPGVNSFKRSVSTLRDSLKD